MFKKAVLFIIAMILAIYAPLSVTAFADSSIYPYTDMSMDIFEPDAGVVPVRAGYCGNMGSNVSWTLYSDGTLTITGQGNMANFGTSGSTASPWFKNSDVKKIIIEYGVTSVSNYAFYDCPNITSIILPDGMKQLGAGFMHGCAQVDKIDIPKSVTAIGPYSFAGCSSLTSVVIPIGVTAIHEGTFQNCENLNSVVFTNAVTDIESDIFYKTPNAAIQSYNGTYAKEFAENNNIPFEHYVFHGDTNLDFNITEADLPYILDYIKTEISKDEHAAANADIYTDEIIDIRDFNNLYNTVFSSSDK